MGNDEGGLRGRELGDIGLRGGAPLAECWIGGKWEDGGLMWWFCGEREEREEGERESSETGRRLYCCMEEALGTGRIRKCVEWRGGYIRGAGFVSAIACDLLGIERKWVKDRTEVMGFDFDSRGEGKRDEKEQRADQIGSPVFHSGPRVRIATCQSVTLRT